MPAWRPTCAGCTKGHDECDVDDGEATSTGTDADDGAGDVTSFRNAAVGAHEDDDKDAEDDVDNDVEAVDNADEDTDEDKECDRAKADADANAETDVTADTADTGDAFAVDGEPAPRCGLT